MQVTTRGHHEGMDIRGQVALVTGASRGLGEALSKALARRGARVVLVARGADDLERVARAIRAEGGEAHALAFDVGDKSAIHRIAGAAAALVGPPSIVVHNASTLGPVPLPLLLDTECEDLERVLAVNLVGPFRLTKALAGPMVLKKAGVFLFVSSDAAVSAYPRWGAYGVSKAAQDHLARVLAAEMEPLRFFSVDPGEMDTKMHADAVPDADPATMARPEHVAERLVAIVQRAESLTNGARLLAADFEIGGAH
ncbi:MAG TPA: SDR family oxidoreductase [Labilithrix sp.]|jgi:NAD(P)-dependent dehydrogenase (short-subunit alcohol dehydrogenase family)|nr:SDR family oxidoreductase [Labilithrix sp.]